MYNVKNEQGEYFVDWLIDDKIVFNKDRLLAKAISISAACNLCEILYDRTGEKYEIVDCSNKN